MVAFLDSSDSGDSTIICNGDSVGSDNPAAVEFAANFGGSTIRGRTRVILHGNGKMEVSVVPGYTVEATVGSIEGDGNIFLGDPALDKLVIGTNNRSTVFTGIIQDDPYHGQWLVQQGRHRHSHAHRR